MSNSPDLFDQALERDRQRSMASLAAWARKTSGWNRYDQGIAELKREQARLSRIPDRFAIVYCESCSTSDMCRPTGCRFKPQY